MPQDPQWQQMIMKLVVLLILLFPGYWLPRGTERMMEKSIDFVICATSKDLLFQNLFLLFQKTIIFFSQQISIEFIISMGLKTEHCKSCQFQNFFFFFWLANHKLQCEFLQEHSAMSQIISLASESLAIFPTWRTDAFLLNQDHNLHLVGQWIIFSSVHT